MKVVTARQMQDIEAIAIEKYGIPALLLMENAAIGVVRHVMEAVQEIKNPIILVAAGTGNNGGDGLAAARLLFARGMEVRVLVAGYEERMPPDARANFDRVKALGIPVDHIVPDDWPERYPEEEIITAIRQSDVVLDALFGTGLKDAPKGCYAAVIEAINRHARLVISVDIPSGICADTGQVPGAAVRADRTVTFAFPKRGLWLYPGAGYTGEMTVENISIPDSVSREAAVKSDVLTDREAAVLLPARPARSNKGTFGKAYVLAGCAEMPGAAVMTASAAYRTGAGLVVAGVVKDVARVLQAELKEAVTRILPDQDGCLCQAAYERIAPDLSVADVIAMGPGMGRNPQANEFVKGVLRHAKAPLVLDADALFAIADDPAMLRCLNVSCVVTPHPGEMSRLTGKPIEQILSDTVGEALLFAEKYGVVTVLKDARTIVASPDGRFTINTTGSPAMAKAGSGDVLAGIITGLMAQGVESYEAARLAVYVHGKAGAHAEKELSGYSVNAMDLIAHLAPVLRELEV